MQQNLLLLASHLFVALPGLINKAQAAFSGQPGSGALKKQMVHDGLLEVLGDITILNPTLVTPAQSDAIVAEVMALVDLYVLSMNNLKAFQSGAIPQPPVGN